MACSLLQWKCPELLVSTTAALIKIDLWRSGDSSQPFYKVVRMFPDPGDVSRQDLRSPRPRGTDGEHPQEEVHRVSADGGGDEEAPRLRQPHVRARFRTHDLVIRFAFGSQRNRKIMFTALMKILQSNPAARINL